MAFLSEETEKKIVFEYVNHGLSEQLLDYLQTNPDEVNLIEKESDSQSSKLQLKRASRI